MGGYASFPVCFAAIFLRIPFVIYENNLIIGKVNRLLIPFAKKILVSYGELDGVSTKYKNKISLIGNILRENIISYSKKRENNYDKLKILVCFFDGWPSVSGYKSTQRGVIQKKASSIDRKCALESTVDRCL